MRNEASLLGEQREILRGSGPVGGVWGSCVPSGVQGQEPLVAGSRGVPQPLWRGPGRGAPDAKTKPLDLTQTQPAETDTADRTNTQASCQHQWCVARWDNTPYASIALFKPADFFSIAPTKINKFTSNPDRKIGACRSTCPLPETYTPQATPTQIRNARPVGSFRYRATSSEPTRDWLCRDP
jgi:hypothetical protein